MRCDGWYMCKIKEDPEEGLAGRGLRRLPNRAAGH